MDSTDSDVSGLGSIGLADLFKAVFALVALHASALVLSASHESAICSSSSEETGMGNPERLEVSLLLSSKSASRPLPKEPDWSVRLVADISSACGALSGLVWRLS